MKTVRHGEQPSLVDVKLFTTVFSVGSRNVMKPFRNNQIGDDKISYQEVNIFNTCDVPKGFLHLRKNLGRALT